MSVCDVLTTLCKEVEDAEFGPLVWLEGKFEVLTLTFPEPIDEIEDDAPAIGGL